MYITFDIIFVRPEADLQVLMLSVRSSRLFKIGVRLRRTYVLQHIFCKSYIEITHVQMPECGELSYLWINIAQCFP